ncbi:Peptidyl-prolyl cis-trans isomerase D [Vanrija pseudolonga]|uniref:peptidylprolyl isomerase n=1 Tax=Vanrija pseudolonga TaxID=143232 RepID=A0AAF0Y4C3_9TREE|nr:Peptidyl-prolyl cis-trans isomerase D [Vanrija pseudolonga]
MPLPRTFFDFTVGDKPLGRVVFELFTDVVPKTAENFRALSTGEKGQSASGATLSYKGSPVHRVIDGFMIQGGDFTKRNGSGGESIYGGMFKDERLSGDGTEVDREGLLVMANRGPDTNGSQWFITLAAAPHLTGKHVVFGRVVSGMEHIRAIGKLETDGRDRPHSPVIVSHAGELELRKPAVTRPRTPSVSSDSEDEEERRRRKERRERKEREREERREERRKRKEKDGRDRDRSRSPQRRRDSRSPRKETLDELDARLEREEKERLEAARRDKLSEIKTQIATERAAVRESGGVVYKGRGAMRYRDPESGGRSNDAWRTVDSRAPPRRRRLSGDRWERGADARPQFERSSRADMDRWDRGGEREARERREAGGGGLGSRIGGRAGADDAEAERDRERERDDPARAARAGAWRSSARRDDSPRRESPPPRDDDDDDDRRRLSPGPRAPSPTGSDMQMDGDE